MNPRPRRAPAFRLQTLALAALAWAFSCVEPAAVLAQTPPAGRSASPTEQAFAANPARRLLWLRATEAAVSELELRVERALGRVLSELGYLPNRSPLPFRDAQLASGCVGGLRECGGRVASALDSEQLLVSALQTDGDAPTARLSLHRFEVDRLTKTGSAVLPLSPPEDLELTVRALAESVFDADGARARARATPVAAARPDRSPSARDAGETAAPSAASTEPAGSPALRGVGWTAVGLGAAGAIGAIATAVSAGRESEAYARADLRESEDVDRALRHYDRAQNQSDVARVLGGVSAGVMAAGAFMLCWEYFGRRPDRNLHSSRTDEPRRTDIHVAAWPQRLGAMVSLGVEL